MTEEERKARVWLAQATGPTHYLAVDDDKHRATILALLDRPVMPRPEEVPVPVLQNMAGAAADGDGVADGMRAAIKVLHDWRTKPAEPRKVEAWAVKMDDGDTELFRCFGVATARRLQLGLGDDRIVHLREVEADHD